MAPAELPSGNKFKLLSHVFVVELTRLDAKEPVKQAKVHEISSNFEVTDLSKLDGIKGKVVKENTKNDFSEEVIESIVRSVPTLEYGEFVSFPHLACKENVKDKEGLIEVQGKVQLPSKLVHHKKKFNKELNLFGLIKWILIGRKLGILGESVGATSSLIS
ncbi:hypothetical protein MA16_Dca021770 [Dendrobium catenatum]|uniref:Uncharacterized protein n=1 Tax=Dendrobium catenatum TaxID=906689 RepID=A0A2I0VXE1_9ASPA|nr:hypothetical protein MA16_Dca021770 [Dendrobium catenatum]